MLELLLRLIHFQVLLGSRRSARDGRPTFDTQRLLIIPRMFNPIPSVSSKGDSMTALRSNAIQPGYERLQTLAGLCRAKYEFRLSARRSDNAVFTWVDQDNSGNYNPGGIRDEDQSNAKRKRGTVNHDRESDRFRNPKRPKIMTWKLGRQLGLTHPVTLKCTSDHGRTLLRQLSAFPDNWPDSASDSSAETDHYSSISPASKDCPSTGFTSESSQSYLLKNNGASAPRRGRPAFSAMPSSASDVPDISELTLGHPEARGCKPCLKLGQVCPLLSEGSTYPCDLCVEDDVECELVLPPLKKRACEGCQSRRLKCSYRDGGDHSLPCKQCSQLNHKCVAGPQSGRTRTGPCLDQDLNKLPMRRPFVSCTICRREKRWCSLKDRSKFPPCRYCHQHDLVCTFEKLGDAEKTAEPISTTEPVKPPQPLDVPPKQLGVTKTIVTWFAHPIAFNYEPPEDDSQSCHFCEHAAYGMIGLGRKEVEVLDYGNGEGYIEVSGGHTGEGRETSRMCVVCTMERLRIRFCQAHTIRPIADMDPEDFDFTKAFQELFTNDPSTQDAATVQWCSVCSSPAFFECCAAQAMDIYGCEASPGSPEATGCALLLCESCAVSLTEDHGGDLESLVIGVEAEEDDTAPRLRADAPFFLSNRELFKQVYPSPSNL